MEPFTKTGGARIGWTNASWPLAKLSAAPDKLTLAVKLLGTYSFSPEQVSSMERYSMIPVLGWGVRIHHTVLDYPQKVIFWCLGDPSDVLDGIQNAGFVAKAAPETTKRIFPMRVLPIAAVIIIWNGLFLLSAPRWGSMPAAPGWGACAAVLAMFSLCLGLLYSPAVQRIMLKPGRSLGEIRPLVRLVLFISGIMSVMLVLMASGIIPVGHR